MTQRPRGGTRTGGRKRGRVVAKGGGRCGGPGILGGGGGR
ncbi:hypothetical protein TIFTF001_004722 [Ficus carica]|uniref:Uncharacterized protein n=1 Tax=Ficus carica TaxID=3494 RepID=A0AA87ZK65_FICCA|nr:hypothetical protein TIFTF001_004722 [Ficus carica]